jgi:cytochrome c biogenesis protein CcmG/thiol:disulfide interchange protein DsbE
MRTIPLASRLLVVVAALALAADHGKPVTATLEPSNSRQPAPSFNLKDLSGRPVNLSAYRGKVVLLNFWATWCGGCKEELPWFDAFQKSFGKDRLAVVAVATDDEGAKLVAPYVDRIKPVFQTLLTDGTIEKSYEIQTMPDTFLIDRTGSIAAVYRGLVDREDIERNLKAMLESR